MSVPRRMLSPIKEVWPGHERWTLEALLTEFEDQPLALGIDEESGDSVTMPLGEYLAYATRQSDDSPLYIFDDWILGQEGCPLYASYTVPRCFENDYMGCLGECRPPHRWLLIGGARSGTAPHVDPWGTAAWNTLVSGRKRWVIFPPHEVERVAALASTAAAAAADGEPLESAAHWFHRDYIAACSGAADGGVLDFEQQPGETVYVPDGWLHAVVNLELSVAVTHNFVGPHNVLASHRAMAKSDPVLAAKWLRLMLADARVATSKEFPLSAITEARAESALPQVSLEVVNTFSTDSPSIANKGY